MQDGENPLEEIMAIHSSTLAWEIPWTEEPGRSMGLQSVGPDLRTKQQQQPHSAAPLEHRVPCVEWGNVPGTKDTYFLVTGAATTESVPQARAASTPKARRKEFVRKNCRGCEMEFTSPQIVARPSSYPWGALLDKPEPHGLWGGVSVEALWPVMWKQHTPGLTP